MKKFCSEYPQNATEFIDRTEIITLVKNEFHTHLTRQDYFKVFVVHGIGGIGKSRLTKELVSVVQDIYPGVQVLKATFELSKQGQRLDNLIHIRKVFGRPCVLFDYALLLYWDKNRVEKLNDDFIKSIKATLPGVLTDVFADLIQIPISIPSVAALIDIVNLASMKIRTALSKDQEIIKKIPSMAEDELIDSMAYFLGTDIRRYLEKTEHRYIFVFDSYQQKQPYSHSEDWLLHLIAEIERGVVIITSREELPWDDNENELIIYQLNSYPEKDARELLNKYMKDDAELVEVTLKSTQCIPIYVDLAINIYLQEKNISPTKIVKKSLFSDQRMLVKHFISHLKKEWQDVILDLSIIRIFNREIFEHLVKDLNIYCPTYDFDGICQSSLCNYIENTNGLVKIHDVFATNALVVCDKEKQIQIINSYLQYLSKRGTVSLSDSQLAMIGINLLQTLIDTDSEFYDKSSIFSEEHYEMTMDIFLCLANRKCILPALEVNISYSDGINNLLRFLSILFGNITTIERVNFWKNITTPQQFGKHEKSLAILGAYSYSLSGQYNHLKDILEETYAQLSSCEQLEWYYSKTKIYLSDYWLITGKFVEAHKLLLEYENEMSNLFTVDDYFLAERSIGHILRFNMELEMAEDIYTKLLEKYEGVVSIKAYLLTNLCETLCYFRPDKFALIYAEAFNLVTQLSQPKNLGKLLYSKAISEIASGQFESANRNITECIKVNEKEGYQSGKLFGYMAKAYYDYGKYGIIREETVTQIQNILDHNGVYKFFRLQIALLQKNESDISALRDQYSWLDYDNTIKMYKNYVHQYHL